MRLAYLTHSVSFSSRLECAAEAAVVTETGFEMAHAAVVVVVGNEAVTPAETENGTETEAGRATGIETAAGIETVTGNEIAIGNVIGTGMPVGTGTEKGAEAALIDPAVDDLHIPLSSCGPVHAWVVLDIHFSFRLLRTLFGCVMNKKRKTCIVVGARHFQNQIISQ